MIGSDLSLDLFDMKKHMLLHFPFKICDVIKAIEEVPRDPVISEVIFLTQHPSRVNYPLGNKSWLELIQNYRGFKN